MALEGRSLIRLDDGPEASEMDVSAIGTAVEAARTTG